MYVQRVLALTSVGVLHTTETGALRLAALRDPELTAWAEQNDIETTTEAPPT